MTVETAVLPSELPALSGAESQAVYRACLTALSQPGRVVTLHPLGRPAATLPLLALTDPTTTTASCGDADALLRESAAVTGAPVGALEVARYVLALAEPSERELTSLALGTDREPQLGAALVLAVESLRGGAGSRRLALRGPGIRDTAALPRGIDLLLVAENGDLVGLPRTTLIDLDGVAE